MMQSFDIKLDSGLPLIGTSKLTLENQNSNTNPTNGTVFKVERFFYVQYYDYEYL